MQVNIKVQYKKYKKSLVSLNDEILNGDTHFIHSFVTFLSTSMFRRSGVCKHRGGKGLGPHADPG